MSRRGMTTQDRADRQKVMMGLRSWMTENDVSRRDVAEAMKITTGHLSTLINANRTASQEQVDIARDLMDGRPITPRPAAPKKAEKAKPAPTASGSRSARPLTRSEGEFVGNLAKAWLKDHGEATRDEFVDVVRVLSNAIRS